MKAVTLYEPWATLIAEGRKRVETRHWAPPRSLCGKRIAIHAARRYSAGQQKTAEQFGINPLELRATLGCVIATAQLAGWFRVKDDGTGVFEHIELDEQVGLIVTPGEVGSLEWEHFGDLSTGRYGWLLRNVRRLVSAPVIGRQGFWNWEPDGP